MKSIIQVFLLVVVVAGIAVGFLKNVRMQSTDDAPEGTVGEEEAASIAEAKVRVTYFTSDTRCASCKKIESLTIETLQEQFPDALADGSLVFETHNIDRPENQSYVDKYELAFKTVVVEQLQNDSDEWKRMDEVWKLLDKPEAFKQYIATEVRRNLVWNGISR